MKISDIVDIDFHGTSKEHVVICKGRFTGAVSVRQPHYSFISMCVGTICSSSREGQVRITGISPQGPITAPDAKVSWWDAWLKTNDREHFIFQSVLFLRSKCAHGWLLFSSLQPIEAAWRSEDMRNENNSPFIFFLYLFFHPFNKYRLMPAIWDPADIPVD